MHRGWIGSEMKARLAKWMVHCVARTIDHAYGCYCEDKRHMEKAWNIFGTRLERVFFPIARQLDKEAFTTQLIDESWWG